MSIGAAGGALEGYVAASAAESKREFLKEGKRKTEAALDELIAEQKRKEAEAGGKASALEEKVLAALGGEPGVRSARYAGEPSDTPANNALLLKNLEGVTDRRANFTCCVALIDPNGEEHVLAGRCYGTISESASGSGGFGYDPLFIPDGHSKSFAELSADEKNAISHRGRALAEVQKCIQGFKV